MTAPTSSVHMGPDANYLARCRARMQMIDALPADVRSLVHEYGWTVVDAFLKIGVHKAKQIKHLIETVREGSASYSNGTCGVRMRDAELRDLARRNPDLAVLPAAPTEVMLRASMDEVTPAIGPLTKREKHLRRLRAAIAAGREEFVKGGRSGAMQGGGRAP